MTHTLFNMVADMIIKQLLVQHDTHVVYREFLRLHNRQHTFWNQIWHVHMRNREPNKPAIAGQTLWTNNDACKLRKYHLVIYLHADGNIIAGGFGRRYSTERATALLERRAKRGCKTCTKAIAAMTAHILNK